MGVSVDRLGISGEVPSLFLLAVGAIAFDLVFPRY